MIDTYGLNRANYAAIMLFDELGVEAPTQSQIDMAERVLSTRVFEPSHVEAQLLGVISQLGVVADARAKQTAIKRTIEIVLYGTRGDLAINVLTQLGIISPTQMQITFVEEMLLGAEPQDDLSCVSFLTDRQKQCLYWAAQGRNADETAKQMNIGVATVRSHREAIRVALNCKNMTHAVYKWMKLCGIDELPTNETVNLTAIGETT